VDGRFEGGDLEDVWNVDLGDVNKFHKSYGAIDSMEKIWF
jgi:hypothetical protein